MPPMVSPNSKSLRGLSLCALWQVMHAGETATSAMEPVVGCYSGQQPDPVARLPVDTYRRRLGNVETRGPKVKKAVKQRGAKNGESENPQTKSRDRRAQPPWLHVAPQVELANRRMRADVCGGVSA